MADFKTVQLATEDLDRLKELQIKLSEQMGFKLSLSQTIMYAVSKLEG